MKTVLLTGATGFLGSHLLEQLVKEYRVVIMKRTTSDTWRIDHLLSSVKSYDIDQVPISTAFEENNIDVVLHTACSYGRANESLVDMLEVNLMFGLELIDQGIRHDCGLFINTDSMLPKTLNKYSLSKTQFVEWLHYFSGDMRVANLKLEHMYGPKDDDKKFVSWMLDGFSKKIEEINLTAGEQKRDFIYISDVVSAFMIVIAAEQGSTTFSEFEVGTGYSVTVRSFVEKLKQKYVQVFGEIDTRLNFGALPYREGELMEVVVDNSALAAMGWRPKMSLDDGITMLLEDYR